MDHNENHFLHAISVVSLCAVILSGLAFSAVTLRVPAVDTDSFAAIFPEVLVLLANQDRGTDGAAALIISPTLQSAAEAKARDMAARGYFAHIAPDGKTPWQWIHDAGYHFAAAGENLAVNFDESNAVERAWMFSPSHRRNLLDRNFTEIGIGTAEGIYRGHPATFVVEFFARPAGSS